MTIRTTPCVSPAAICLLWLFFQAVKPLAHSFRVGRASPLVIGSMHSVQGRVQALYGLLLRLHALRCNIVQRAQSAILVAQLQQVAA